MIARKTLENLLARARADQRKAEEQLVELRNAVKVLEAKNNQLQGYVGAMQDSLRAATEAKTILLRWLKDPQQ